MILTFPLIILRRELRKRTSRGRGDLAIVTAWILGNVLQLAYILTAALGQRKPTGINSPAEVAYLYLDRVIGSTVIPFWGMVSTSTQSPLPDLIDKSNYLMLRALAAISVLLVIALLIIKYCQFTADQRLILLVVLGTGLTQWLVVGAVFNPEPRYAIFSSFCLFFGLVYCFQNLRVENTKVGFAVLTVLLLTWVGSWVPSTLRTEGPNWRTEIHKAELNCTKGAKFALIRTAPINKTWEMKIPCRYILNNL
jgi:hypothetical protein